MLKSWQVHSSQMHKIKRPYLSLDDGDLKNEMEHYEQLSKRHCKSIDRLNPSEFIVERKRNNVIYVNHLQKQSAQMKSMQTRYKSNQPHVCLQKWQNVVQHQEDDFHLYKLNTDTLAHCLSYLTPKNVNALLNAPLSRKWHSIFGNGNNPLSECLWKTLCASAPFFVDIGEEISGKAMEEDERNGSVRPGKNGISYRHLYSLLVKCTQYANNVHTHFDVTEHCQSSRYPPPLRRHPSTNNISTRASPLTANLLGFSVCGGKRAGNLKLSPSSPCAIYSVVNWMAAFPYVPGIQAACLKTLEVLLEDDGMRRAANSLQLLSRILLPNLERHSKDHTSISCRDNDGDYTCTCIDVVIRTLRALVLLSRPCGSKQGMMKVARQQNQPQPLQRGFNNEESMLEAEMKCAIPAVIKSMKCYPLEPRIQKMGCWSMVNMALQVDVRRKLMGCGGIQVVLEAMKQHPLCFDVQLKALLALINLMMISDKHDYNEKQNQTEPSLSSNHGCANSKSCYHILFEAAPEIAFRTLAVMKGYFHCKNKAILNRSICVLYNMSRFHELFHYAFSSRPSLVVELDIILGLIVSLRANEVDSPSSDNSMIVDGAHVIRRHLSKFNYM